MAAKLKMLKFITVNRTDKSVNSKNNFYSFWITDGLFLSTFVKRNGIKIVEVWIC